MAQTTVTLSPVASPSSGQAGVHNINVTGSNYPGGTIPAANVSVTLTPSTAGAGLTATTTATTVTVLSGTTRRIGFQIPAAISVTQPTAYLISIAGKTSDGVTFVSGNKASITVNPPPKILSLTPASISQGQSATVAMTTEYTNFVQGSTQANFGPGVTVGAGAPGGYGFITVTSPTSATAQVSIAANAAPGFQRVTIKTGVQTAILDATFQVTAVNRPPTANAGGPYTGLVGEPIALAGSGTDEDGDPLLFTWNFADGSSGTGQKVEHAYADPGQFTVTLTVNDQRGGIATATATVNVTRPNRPPSANAGGPYSGNVGAEIAFDGTLSSDPDQDPLTYEWAFGDGATGSGNQPSHAYKTAGTYDVTLTVRDGRGGVATATSTAVVALPNRAPTAVPGGPYTSEVDVAVSFDGTGSTDPDQESLTFEWDFGDGTAGSGGKPSHAYQSSGTFQVTLTVRDPRGLSAVATTQAIISAAVDRSPPVISLSGPKEALPGAEALMTAQATDNVGVTAVTFRIDGTNPTESPATPYQRLVNIPPLAAPGTLVRVTAEARDAANNSATAEATITIVAKPDLEKPVVSLRLPETTAPGGTIHMAANAFDEGGVKSIEFFGQNVSFATRQELPYDATYQVPADAPVGSTIAFIARATDYSGNTGEAIGSVLVVQIGDTTPPDVDVTVPPTVVPGTPVVVEPTAIDAGGVVSIEVRVNGVLVAIDQQPPFDFSVTIPPDLPPGTQLTIEVRAIDFAGHATVVTKEVEVVAVGRGVLTGEVYDDTNGLPLPDAVVSLTGTDSRGIAYAQVTSTDKRGRYAFVAVEGDAVIKITKPGWTQIDRPTAVVPAKALELIDARSTPLAPGTSVSPISGGTISMPRGGVTVPPGALGAPVNLSATTLSQQAIQGLLPAGWSPVHAVDIQPVGVQFDVPVSIRFDRPATLPNNASLVFATWDRTAHQWRAIGLVPAPAGTTIESSVSSSGQYAWLLPDVVPAAPVPPAPGELLPGVQPTVTIPGGETTFVDPNPEVAFYQPGVKSEVRGEIRPTTPVTSGTLVLAKIDERYQFYSGDHVNPEPMVQDLIFYQYPATAGAVAASHTVSPSLVFEPLTLEQGVITVALNAPPSRVREVDTATPSGGVITVRGLQLHVPAGAVPDATPVNLVPFTQNELGVPLPTGVEFIDGALVSFVGAFGEAAALSLTVPPGFTDASRVVVARVQVIAGQNRLVLVGLGKISDGRLISDVTLPSPGFQFEGVRVAGRYVFLRLATPFGFAAGTVRGLSGSPFSGAMVSSNSLALVSISQLTGRYASVVGIGGVQLTAVDVDRNDVGTAQGTLETAGQLMLVDLNLAARPPSVTSVTPASGSGNVALSEAIVISFSEPIDSASATPQNVLFAPSGGSALLGAIALSGNNTTLTFRPAQPLAPNTSYTLTLTPGIKDLAGYGLAAPFETSFTSLDTLPPPPPAAGAIAATIPVNGQTTITATQGTAATHDTVLVRNLTTGQSVPCVLGGCLNPNGSFTLNIAASVGHKLQLVLRDVAGNETVITIASFRQANADGSISETVGPEGGHIAGPGGIGVDVPAGAFPDSTIITLKPVAEADYPIQLTAEQRAFLSYSGGINLDLGGKIPQQYLNLSVPLQGGETEADRWIVGIALTVGAETVMEAVDTARVINGRIRTSSPPCPGATGSGVYGFLRAARPAGVVYGRGPAARPEETSFLLASALVHGFTDIASGAALLMPGLGALAVDQDLYAFRALNQSFCVPLLAGRVSVVRNRMLVTIPSGQLTAQDAELKVTNVTRNVTERYHPPFPSRLTAEGGMSDTYLVEAVGFSGASRNLTFSVAPRPVVHVHVGHANLSVDDRKIVIRNVTRNLSWSSALTGSPFVPVLNVDVTLEGTTDDTYKAEVTDVNGVTRDVAVLLAAYSIGTGNLLLRALPGTIDPTKAEIDAANALIVPPAQPIVGSGVTSVVLTRSGPSGTHTEPLMTNGTSSVIVGGGFTVAMDGSFEEDEFSLRIVYEDGKQELLNFPRFRVTVRQTTTGNVTTTITGQVPPLDETLVLNVYSPGSVTPTLETPDAELIDVDPTKPLRLVFSAPISRDQQHLFALWDTSTNTKVTGKLIFSHRDQVLTFVPDSPLKLGGTYQFSLIGMTDLLGQPLSTQTIPVTTFTPQTLSTYTEQGALGALPFLDGVVRQKPIPTGGTRSWLIAGSGNTDGFKIHVIDVTNPTIPQETGHTGGGRIRRLAFLPDVNFAVNGQSFGCSTHISSGNQYFGELLAASLFSNFGSSVNFFDPMYPNSTADPQPCILGGRPLTRNPETLPPPGSGDISAKGTIKGVGFASGVALLPHDSGVAAYVAVAEMGLMPVNVGGNIPSVFPENRTVEGIYSGDYVDVVAIDGRLLALNANYGGMPTLEVLDPNLSPITSVPLESGKAHDLTIATGVQTDRNEDGTIGADEIFSFAFVVGTSGITVVDITDIEAPALIRTFSMPGTVRRIAISADGRRGYVVGDAPGGGGDGAFYIVDVSNPFITRGNRVIYQKTYPLMYVNGIAVDQTRGLAFVAFHKGIDIITTEAPNLTGTITYARYPVDLLNTNPASPQEYINYSRGFIKPVRGAVVELYDSANHLIARTNTTPAGHYSFHAPQNSVVTVVVRAELGPPTSPRVIVRDSSVTSCSSGVPNCDIHHVKFSLPVGNGRVVKDYYAESGWDGTKYSSASDRQSGPFAILDTAYEAEAFLKETNPSLLPPTLTFEWSPTQAADPNAESHFDPSTQTIRIKGQEDVDTDEYDRMVLLHEYGHYAMRLLGRNDGNGGTHRIGNCLWTPQAGCTPQDELDPSVAFSEGFATAFAAIVAARTADYIDTSICDASGCTPDNHIYFTDTSDAKQGNVLSPNGSALGFFPVDVNIGIKGIHSETSVATLILNLAASLGPNALAMIQQAVKAMGQSAAFTNISSFLKFLSDAAGPGGASIITSLSQSESIPVTDEFGPASMYSPNNPVVVDADPIEAATSVTPSPTDGGPTTTYSGNKLGNFVYFTVSDLHSRSQTINCYTFLIEPRANPNGTMPTLELRIPRPGKDPLTQIGTPGIVGNYSLKLGPNTFAVGARATSAGDRAAQFKVRVRFESVGVCPTP